MCGKKGIWRCDMFDGQVKLNWKKVSDGEANSGQGRKPTRWGEREEVMGEV